MQFLLRITDGTFYDAGRNLSIDAAPRPAANPARTRQSSRWSPPLRGSDTLWRRAPPAAAAHGPLARQSRAAPLPLRRRRVLQVRPGGKRAGRAGPVATWRWRRLRFPPPRRAASIRRTRYTLEMD